MPVADIYEADHDLMVVLEMPGVEKTNVEISVEDRSSSNVEGRLDLAKYQESAAYFIPNTISGTTHGVFGFRARSTRTR